MPVHDWLRVDAGTFQAFHTAWMTHLSEAMNEGLLPSGYYAMPEQHPGRLITDVLTLHASPPSPAPPPGEGGLAVAEAPPRVSRRLTASAGARARQRTLTVRHVSGHRVVAIMEIVSQANKDRPRHVDELATKIASALGMGVHVLLADLFPPGSHDPRGMHGEVWERIDPGAEAYDPPPGSPLLLASYAAGPEVEAWLEPVAVGEALRDMPLFLHPDRYVNVPLDSAYQAAFRGMPAYWRHVLASGAGGRLLMLEESPHLGWGGGRMPRASVAASAAYPLQASQLARVAGASKPTAAPSPILIPEPEGAPSRVFHRR